MKTMKINVTKNYRMFTGSDTNRPLDLTKHKKLKDSMEKYGFLSVFPVVCCRNKCGALVVIDGQHRLAFAESLGLPVHWIEGVGDAFDVVDIPPTVVPWIPRDTAMSFVNRGKDEYQEGLDFADTYKMAICTAFALLAGTTNFGNIAESFRRGEFRVMDWPWAKEVAELYTYGRAYNKHLRNSRFLLACMAACRVSGFSPSRLIRNMNRCRDKLAPYSTRDAYLDMIETIYNFGVPAKQLLGLKLAAIQAMRERQAIKTKAAG